MGTFLSNLWQPEMFSQAFMVNAFITATVVAILAALVGFFVVLRGSAFVAHALPKVGFAGAAGAVMVNTNPLFGLALFSVGGAVTIGFLGKKGRHDVVTALTLVVSLGVGSLFLVIANAYATGAYALLFGQLVGVSTNNVLDTALLGLVCLIVFFILYRPLLFSSIAPESAQARGIPTRLVELVFLIVVGLTTAITVPVAGALLCFSLMIGPAATTQFLTNRPAQSLLLSVTLSVVNIWLAIILAYDTGWPVGFFVAIVSALFYSSARVWFYIRNKSKRMSFPPSLR